MKIGYTISNLQKRLLVLTLLITFLFGVIILRLSYIQIINADWLGAKALDQWTRDVPIKAQRGNIYDTNGNAIAVGLSTYDVYVRPKSVESASSLSRSLCDILDLEYETVYNKIINRTLSEIVITMHATAEQKQQIIAQNLVGVVFGENSSRYYPYGDLFTQILGYTTVDGIGQSGLEYFYNEYLKGVNGYILTESDVQGVEIDNSVNTYIPSIKGLNITTTLDSTIQALLEEQMEKALIEQKASSVTAIVMNPKTGEILAMGSKPSFDLNDVPRDDLESLLNYTKNMAVIDVYEPGSTFKILTSSIALDEGLVTLEERFYDPGYRMVDGQKIKCWKTTGHGDQSFTDGFCNSCNSVFIDLALRIGLDKFYERVSDFGLGQLTGIDFAGEVGGILMNQDSVKNVDLARMGFGQAIAVTPIQLITALSATVNGGYLMQPYLLKSISDNNGNILSETSSLVKSQVISAETSAIIRFFLEEAVSRPLGQYTFLENYCVGGKTGTTQKYVDGKISNTFIASFFGAFPCDDPEYVILFIVDEPTAGSYFGSIAASPYAKEVFKGIIASKNYQPVATDIVISNVEMPNLMGLSLTEASKKLIEINLQYEIVGSGDIVVDQFPSSGTILKQNEVVQITTN